MNDSPFIRKHGCVGSVHSHDLVTFAGVAMHRGVGSAYQYRRLGVAQGYLPCVDIEAVLFGLIRFEKPKRGYIREVGSKTKFQALRRREQGGNFGKVFRPFEHIAHGEFVGDLSEIACFAPLR